MTIDFHFHYMPKALVDKYGTGTALAYQSGAPTSIYQPRMYDVERHLEGMEIAGVDMAVVSSQAALWGSLDEAKLINDSIAELTTRFPTRFMGLAHIPLRGGDAALRELERGVKELRFRGIIIPCDIGGVGLDSREFWPLYELVQALDVYVFVHSSPRTLRDDVLLDYDMLRCVGREVGLCMAVVRLINGGVLEAFPRLRVQIAHMGGTLPSVLPRILKYQDRELWGTAGDPSLGRLPAQPFEELLRRLFFDTGGAVSVMAGLQELHASQCVLGTDYPLDFTTPDELKGFVDAVRTLPIPPEAVRGILGENGRALLGLDVPVA